MKQKAFAMFNFAYVILKSQKNNKIIQLFKDYQSRKIKLIPHFLQFVKCKRINISCEEIRAVLSQFMLDLKTHVHVYILFGNKHD